jgi:hypothetical protein
MSKPKSQAEKEMFTAINPQAYAVWLQSAEIILLNSTFMRFIL